MIKPHKHMHKTPDNITNSYNWTGHNGTEWQMPRLVEMFILGIFGGFGGMALSYVFFA